MVTWDYKRIEDIYRVTRGELEAFRGMVISGSASLDIGTSRGRYVCAAREAGFKQVYGLDIDPGLIEIARSSITPPEYHFIVGDILNPSGQNDPE